MINNLAQGLNGTQDLRHLLRDESTSIKDHITNEIHQRQRNQSCEKYYKQFLASLWFPEMNSRQERIHAAHKKTFQWIYESRQPNKADVPWDNFVEWLDNGHGVYWITGKAGSGKTTLMNYISHDERTSSSLKAWSGTKMILTPCFFFWNAGTEMQKSIEGLLRSLIHQILEKCPELIPLLEQNGSAGNGQRDYGHIAAWTEPILVKTLQSVIGYAQGSCRMCFFIDGLDEFSGDQQALIPLIQGMQTVDVKLCLSSRPYQQYSKAFGSSKTLRLQELTWQDIRTFVIDNLQPVAQESFVEDISELVDYIVEKARGVFLWVELVVKDLIKGLENDDSLRQLQMRVESTPANIEALFTKMLTNIDVAHKPEAAILFHLVLNKVPISLLDAALALNEAFKLESELSCRHALELSRRTQRRIPTVCAGLLEVNLEDEAGRLTPPDYYISLPVAYTCSLERADMSFHERHAQVGFIHRTAIDFLRQNGQGQHFLVANIRSHPNLHVLYARALLAKVTLLGFPEKPANMDIEFKKYARYPACFHDDGWWDDFVDRVAAAFTARVMQSVCLDEIVTGTAQVSLCDDVDRTLATMYQRRSHSASPNPHWSTQWGLKLFGGPPLGGPPLGGIMLRSRTCEIELSGVF